MAYTWMREPTKVTRMTKVRESGSTSSPKSTVKSPAGIQVKSVWEKRLDDGSEPSIWAATAAPIPKDAHEAAVASQCPQESAARPRSSSRPALTRGTRTIRGASDAAPVADAGAAAAGRRNGVMVVPSFSA